MYLKRAEDHGCFNAHRKNSPNTRSLGFVQLREIGWYFLQVFAQLQSLVLWLVCVAVL